MRESSLNYLCSYCDEAASIGPKQRIKERYRDWEDSGATGLTVTIHQPDTLEFMPSLRERGVRSVADLHVRVRTAGRALVLMSSFAISGLAAGADSEPPPDDAEVIVVTASQTPRPIDQLPGTVDVISREDIERRRDQEVADALRNLAGLHLDQAGGRAGRANLYLRGLDPNLTVVMLDGIRLNDPTNNRGGSFDLTTLDVDSIERIEVVRGPLSAVHGSDAIAGAVNIITRGGRGPDAARLDVSGDPRYGAHRTVASISGQRGPIDVCFSGGYVDTGDPESQSEYEGGHTLLSIGAELPGNADARALFRYVKADIENFPDASGGDDFAVLRTLEQRDVEEITAGLRFAQAPTDWFDYVLSGSFYQRKEDRVTPPVVPGPGGPMGLPTDISDDELQRWEFRGRGTADLGVGFSLALGGDVYKEDGESAGRLDFGPSFSLPILFERERVVGGPFAEVHFESDWGFVADAGVRIDFTDDATKTQFTPRFGAAYQLPWIPLQLRGSVGEGFKVPSFFALGHPLVGNARLKPEKSFGFDIGLRGWAWEDRVQATLTYFDLEVKNLIDLQTMPVLLLVNRTKVVSRGFEFELLVTPIESLDLGGHLTYTNAEIRKSSDELRNRPRWRGDLSAAWRPIEVVALSLSALFVGEARDFSIPTGTRSLDSYVRVDFAAAWRILKHTQVYFAVDNLLNEKYQEALGFPSPGTSPRIGVELRY